MSYKTKILILIVPLIVIPVMVVASVFIFKATRDIQILQTELMAVRLEYLLERCRQANDVLRMSGYTGVSFYVESSQAEILSLAKRTTFRGGGIAIFQSDGTPLVNPYGNLKPPRTVFQEMKEQKAGCKVLDINGKWIMVFRTFEDWNWTLTAVAREDDLFQAIHEARRMAMLITGGILLFALLILYLIIGGISKPINRLTENAKKISQGDFDIQADPAPKDEIGRLTISFLDMSVRLRDSMTQLSESRKRWQDMVNNAIVGFYQVTGSGQLLLANRKMAQMFGYETPEAFLEAVPNISQLYVDPDERLPIVKKLEDDSYLEGLEARFHHRQGHTIWVRIHARRIEDTQKGKIHEGFMLDITNRKQVEEALKENEAKYRQLFEMESDAIFMIEKETGRILEANTAASTMYGYSKAELLERRNVDLSTEPDKTKSATQSDSKTHIPVRYHRKKDGSVFPVEIVASHFTWQGRSVHIAAIRDITFRLQAEEERRQLQTQFQQAQKMEALGTLAGGIAHDFNNLLMGIQGRASLIMADTDTPPSHNEHVKEIETYVKSAASLTRQLLGLARAGKYEVKPTNLNQLIEKTASMFGRTHKEIHVRCHFKEELWSAEIDRGQIEQVLLNLFVNAWQAMPGGGKIFIGTANVLIDTETCDACGVPSGKYLEISVTDTGMGMDEETQKKIFDPFFTTKQKSRGTGLGLASVYGIMRNHGGFVSVKSRVGHGATFKLYLPASDRPIHEADTQSERIVKGSGTILLVDDEEIIIEVGCQLLEALGYQVITARSGKEALTIFQQKYREIDLVILDMIMPQMNGKEIFEKLKVIQPEVNVLLSSGYSVNEQALEILENGCKGFIQKPFNLEELSHKLHETMTTS